jgi:hypothetical protein
MSDEHPTSSSIPASAANEELADSLRSIRAVRESAHGESSHGESSHSVSQPDPALPDRGADSMPADEKPEN